MDPKINLFIVPPFGDMYYTIAVSSVVIAASSIDKNLHESVVNGRKAIRLTIKVATACP